MFKREGSNLKLIPLPEEKINEVRKKEIMCRMLSLTKKKIEVASQKEVEECLQEIKEVTTFYTRGRKYSTLVVTFVSKEEAKKYFVLLKSEQWILLPI